MALDLDALSLRFSRWYIRHRRVNMAIIALLTLFFGYRALQLQVFSQFIDLLPRNHPHIQVYEKYNRQFGSANVVTAAIVARDGDIYDESFLEKVYAFTDQIDKVEGVAHDQVTSITRITIRDQAVDAEGIMRSNQIIGDDALALLEAQFFTRRTLKNLAARGEGVPETLEQLKRAVRERKDELERRLESLGSVLLEQIADAAERRQLRALQKENAELEFLILRLAELPPDYESRAAVFTITPTAA